MPVGGPIAGDGGGWFRKGGAVGEAIYFFPPLPPPGFFTIASVNGVLIGPTFPSDFPPWSPLLVSPVAAAIVSASPLQYRGPLIERPIIFFGIRLDFRFEAICASQKREEGLQETVSRSPSAILRMSLSLRLVRR